MSKEEEAGCKLNPVNYKHKERKPKKPHYIPRPWGKPYNYKCFQCPFTCMEKSHLYNHMKYSLCKNSLSLLIESDWPYKKSNFLIPEMNLHHEAHTDDKQDACDSTGSNSTKPRTVGEKASSEVQRFLEEEDDKPEEEEEEEEEAVGQARKEKIKTFPSLQTIMSKNEANANVIGLKSKSETLKEGEPEFIITDVFSLEGQTEKEREEQKFTKAPRKTSNNLGGSRIDQWKLLTSTLKKGGAETSVGCGGSNIIPCYPPPTYTDYQEHQGLSLLGLNYPLNTNLFSYLSPTMTSGTAQLPFLASAAQLMHPSHASHFQTVQNPERSSYLPRFYYPLLFENAFTASDTKTTAAKHMNQAATPFVTTPKAKTPVEPLKTCLLKSPEATSSIPWGPGDKLQNPTLDHNKSEEEVKWIPQTVKEIIQQQKEILGVYRVQSSRTNEMSIRKRSTDMTPWDKASPTRYGKRKPWLNRDGQDVTEQTATLVEGERIFHNSTSSPSTPPDRWQDKSPLLDVPACKRRRGSVTISEHSEPVVFNASLLIGDLSRTLEEYGKVEQRLANLTSDDSGRQRTLAEQLGKIRMELLHIHQALEKASCPHDGPLDLSIKRTEETGKEDPETIPLRAETPTSPPPECPVRQVVKVELLPPELVSCYARPTKCEADSSVLLCPDGRVGGAAAVQPQVAVQEEGGGIGVGFGRGHLQLENV